METAEWFFKMLAVDFFALSSSLLLEGTENGDFSRHLQAAVHSSIVSNIQK